MVEIPRCSSEGMSTYFCPRCFLGKSENWWGVWGEKKKRKENVSASMGFSSSAQLYFLSWVWNTHTHIHTPCILSQCLLKIFLACFTSGTFSVPALCSPDPTASQAPGSALGTDFSANSVLSQSLCFLTMGVRSLSRLVLELTLAWFTFFSLFLEGCMYSEKWQAMPSSQGNKTVNQETCLLLSDVWMPPGFLPCFLLLFCSGEQEVCFRHWLRCLSSCRLRHNIHYRVHILFS